MCIRDSDVPAVVRRGVGREHVEILVQRLSLIHISVTDLLALERAGGAFRGLYHVLHGKLSPLHGVGPGDLNLSTLAARLDSGGVREVVLALSNDIEGEATCHYLQETFFTGRGLAVSRIGFGLPSGGGLTFADPDTLRSALASRRDYN